MTHTAIYVHGPHNGADQSQGQRNQELFFAEDCDKVGLVGSDVSFEKSVIGSSKWHNIGRNRPHQREAMRRSG